MDRFLVAVAEFGAEVDRAMPFVAIRSAQYNRALRRANALSWAAGVAVRNPVTLQPLPGLDVGLTPTTARLLCRVRADRYRYAVRMRDMQVVSNLAWTARTVRTRTR